MATYDSPGTFVLEKDFSEFAPAVNSSIAGVVGFASQGKPNKAILITSAAQLLRIFGSPKLVEGGQGILGALEILARTNSIYYVRAVTDDAADASGTIAWGVPPTIYVSGVSAGSYSFAFSSTDEVGTSNTPNGDGYILSVVSGAGNNAVGDPGNFAADFLKAQAGVETINWPWTVVSGNDVSSAWVVSTKAGTSSRLTVSSDAKSWRNTTSEFPVLYNASNEGDVPAVGSVGENLQMTQVSGDILQVSGHIAAQGKGGTAADGGAYFVRSLYSGKGYNFSSLTTAGVTSNMGIRVKVQSRAGKTFLLTVFRDGNLEETYALDFELSGAAGNFPENVINLTSEDTDAVSDYIKGEFGMLGTLGNSFTPQDAWGNKITGSLVTTVDAHGVSATEASPRFPKFIDGNYDLSGGNNGDMQGDNTSVNTAVKGAIIGNQAQKTGLYALDDDSLNISMACIPGLTEQTIQNALVSLAEESQNFLAVISPPEGLSTAQDAINWHNGQSTSRSAAVNSSYAAIYWPWLKIFDVFSRTNKTLDPAAFAIATMCHTDSVSDPWFAPAGLVRGRLTKPFDTELALNQGDRDSLYQPGNSVNPIAKFAQDGIVIWGQRTAQRAPSALDRVNIRRMMIVIRKMLLKATRALVFEPNDPITWARVTNVVQPAMDDIRRRRGITEFRVVCDETTNTPLRVDRNELWCRVLIKPTKTAEVLIFELNLTNQSADLG